jgi:hypothetical protein
MCRNVAQMGLCRQDVQRKDESIAEAKRRSLEEVARIKKEAQARAAELRKRMRGQAVQLAELSQVILSIPPIVSVCQAH